MDGIVLEMKKFGKILNSRPAGQEALMRARQLINGSEENTIILDLTSVDVLTPSFADEFINGLKNQYTIKKVEIRGAEGNLLIQETLKALHLASK